MNDLSDGFMVAMAALATVFLVGLFAHIGGVL